jgi:hypothetical protein
MLKGGGWEILPYFTIALSGVHKADKALKTTVWFYFDNKKTLKGISSPEHTILL